MNQKCPKIESCPLFNNQLLKRQESADTYKNLYCNKENRFRECKRYIVSNKVGKCAPYVLPNSFSTADELIARMIKDGIISKSALDN